MTETVDIVRLVESSPLTRFDKNTDYRSKLVDKLQSKFSTEESRLFLTNYYCYLKYEQHEFVIELRRHWKWLGFKRYDEAKRLLVNHFKVDKDYKLVFHSSAENSNSTGRPKEDSFLTVGCFKKLCLKARSQIWSCG